MLGTGPRFRGSYSGQRISRDEAIAKAKTIAPVALANAEKAEKLRRLPKENIDAILESELMPLMRPRRYGGYEADWMTHIDCVSEVARFCGSTGWCMSFLIQHQVYLSFFPQEAQDRVYGEHPDPKIVTAFAPTGKVTEVAGGFAEFRANGRSVRLAITAIGRSLAGLYQAATAMSRSIGCFYLNRANSRSRTSGTRSA